MFGMDMLLKQIKYINIRQSNYMKIQVMLFYLAFFAKLNKILGLLS